MYFKEVVYLKKDKLFESDFKSEFRAYLQSDVTADFKKYLFRDCEISEETTLGDLIAFMEKDLPFWQSIIPFNLELFIEESKKENKNINNKEDEIEFLELYQFLETDILGKKEFHGILFPSFHGVGFAKKEEPAPFRSLKKGDRINYSVSMSPVNELVHLPVRLNKETNLILQKRNFKKTQVIELGEGPYSLIGIIYGIFWEISFHGPPVSRNNIKNSLVQQVNSLTLAKSKISKKKKPTKGKK